MSFTELASATINCSGTTHVFRQQFQFPGEDKYCAVYSVKWLRKRVGRQNFLEKTAIGESELRIAEGLNPEVVARHPAYQPPGTPRPSTEVKTLGKLGQNVAFQYYDAGPSSTFRGKVTGYRNQWLTDKPQEQTEAVATLEGAIKAAQFGFHHGEAAKLTREDGITKKNYLEYLPDPRNPVKVNVFLARHIQAAGERLPAYFYLSWDGHATACSYEELNFYWFDPSQGEFSVDRKKGEKWLTDDRVVKYIDGLTKNSPVDVIGFRRG
jgi:hypothetical protein